MARRLDVWLNRASLREVDARIIIENIIDNAPEMDIEWGAYAGRAGQRIITRRRASREISVEFRIRELFDLAERQRILNAVCQWAQDGWLQTNVQADKRIYVRATGWPGITTPRDYTETFTVTFAAADSPYWEDDYPTTASITSGTTGAATITNLGSEAAPADLTATVTTGTLTSLSVTVGASSISLTGLSVTAGNDVRITHDETGTISIKSGTTSLLDKRTAVSADDLICEPGQNAVGFTANTAVSVLVITRGRYR